MMLRGDFEIGFLKKFWAVTFRGLALEDRIFDQRRKGNLGGKNLEALVRLSQVVCLQASNKIRVERKIVLLCIVDNNVRHDFLGYRNLRHFVLNAAGKILRQDCLPDVSFWRCLQSFFESLARNSLSITVLDSALHLSLLLFRACSELSLLLQISQFLLHQ